MMCSTHETSRAACVLPRQFLHDRVLLQEASGDGGDDDDAEEGEEVGEEEEDADDTARPSIALATVGRASSAALRAEGGTASRARPAVSVGATRLTTAARAQSGLGLESSSVSGGSSSTSTPWPSE